MSTPTTLANYPSAFIALAMERVALPKDIQIEQKDAARLRALWYSFRKTLRSTAGMEDLAEVANKISVRLTPNGLTFEEVDNCPLFQELTRQLQLDTPSASEASILPQSFLDELVAKSVAKQSAEDIYAKALGDKRGED